MLTWLPEGHLHKHARDSYAAASLYVAIGLGWAEGGRGGSVPSFDNRWRYQFRPLAVDGADTRQEMSLVSGAGVSCVVSV